MGKASRAKRAELSPSTIEAIGLAAEVLRMPSVLETFMSFELLKKSPSHRVMAGQLAEAAAGIGDTYMKHALADMPGDMEKHLEELLGLSAEEWAVKFQSAFRSQAFVALVESCVSVAHKQFWKENPIDALMYGDNKRPPANDPIAQAIARVHRRLSSSPKDPRWMSLCLFCFGRMIAVNAKKGFEANVWTDATMLWFDLEKSFLAGKGNDSALLILRANRDYFEGQLPEVIGTRMLHGLAEAAVNARDARLFQ